MSAGELARAITNLHERRERTGRETHRGIIRDTEPLVVDLLGSNLLLDEEDIELGQWVRLYDQSVGLEVGETLVLTRHGDEFVAVDVQGERADMSEIGGGSAEFPPGGDPGEVLGWVGPGPNDVAWVLGTPGPQGPLGPQGPQGVPGEKWHTGSGAPPGATGVVGDWWLDSSSGDFWEKTGTSTWTPRGNLKGPTGATGSTGAAGTPGEKWYSGAGAPPGATGTLGDWYLDTVNGDVYEKTGASTWTVRSNIHGTVAVYEQPGDPGVVEEGSLWIETDATVGYGPMWMKLTQAQYDALSPPDPNYLYVIVG